MSLSKIKKKEIRLDILEHVRKDSKIKISELVEKHHITNKTLYAIIHQLIIHKEIKRIKRGEYTLIIEHKVFTYTNKNLSEDVILKEVFPYMGEMNENAKSCMRYCFTELVNNAIEHSEASEIDIIIYKDAISILVGIIDNGVGIFDKIQKALALPEKEFAVLELAKGKFTTAPDSHTGEGIFFSSKISNKFGISSGGVIFGAKGEDSMIGSKKIMKEGTVVVFSVDRESPITTKQIFDQYTSDPETYGFDKTIIAVKLLEYGEQNAFFVSRSQARRLLARINKFSSIDLDFEGVEEIGQAFADEIFRVYKKEHPEVVLTVLNANKDVRSMINRALSRE